MPHGPSVKLKKASITENPKIPKKVDNCNDKRKKVKVELKVVDGYDQNGVKVKSTPVGVDWVLTYRGQVWESGSVVLAKRDKAFGHKVKYKFYYHPLDEPAGNDNEWRLEATVQGFDSNLSNNVDVKNTKIKNGKCRK